MPPGSEDKRRGKLLPTPVTPATNVCFKIVIPNAVEYKAALFGVLGQLTQWWTWDHPLNGTDCLDCEEAAQLWSKALAEAYFEDDCETPMSCEDIANCIETDASVQEAIAEQIAAAGNQTSIYNTSHYGTPMTASQSSTPLTSAPECALGALFGSITAIVEQLDVNNRDFLEVIEVGTNTRERVSSVIAAIPLLETLPVDDIIAFVDKMQSEILENYEAQWTTSLKDEYRCDLFCLAKDKPECELTFDDLFEYWNNRLGAALEPLNFFNALVQYFVLGTWAGSTIVDIMTLIQLGVWKEASNWSGISLRTLQTVGLLGANDPDPDWELLCEECGEEPPGNNCFGPTTISGGTLIAETEQSMTFESGFNAPYQHFVYVWGTACLYHGYEIVSGSFTPRAGAEYPQGFTGRRSNGTFVFAIAETGYQANMLFYSSSTPFTIKIKTHP